MVGVGGSSPLAPTNCTFPTRSSESGLLPPTLRVGVVRTRSKRALTPRCARGCAPLRGASHHVASRHGRVHLEGISNSARPGTCLTPPHGRSCRLAFRLIGGPVDRQVPPFPRRG